MRLHPTLLGLVFMALAAAYFGYTFTFPALPGQDVGPALFPRVVAVGIFVCGLVITLRGWRDRSSSTMAPSRPGQPLVAVDDSLRAPRARWSFVLMVAAIVFYLVAAPRLGFLPVAAVIVAVLAWWFGSRVWVATLAGVTAALVVQWFFGTVMRIPLPRGLFMQWFFGG
jgi:putative tricarboxylic transport membrane protein